ncbi:hypothetical protein FB451DRAFT_1124201 [Mycena latifolia]|nr:hypothetical protein FB451DRAFT_1124201 [Mycena latifolia]
MTGARRMRARVEEELAEIEIIEPPVRDGEYYFDDGDFVLRVRAENVLFRVHKFLLSRDSSMFKDMFIFPASESSEPAKTTEGSTDATPLVLSDTAVSFRALLWVLYALPPDLQAYLAKDNANLDLKLLLSVAEITNKYHFTSLEAWSMGVVAMALPRLKFNEASSSLLARTMTLADRCNDSALSNAVLVAWERLLQNGVNPAHLINVAEQGDNVLERFIGLTYYSQLSRMKLVRTGMPGSQVVSITGCDGLSQTQISRLMIGRWSLANESNCLEKNPPSLPRGASCSVNQHRDVCTVEWRKVWVECVNAKTVLSVDSADILGRLAAVQERFGNLRKLPTGCGKLNGKDALIALIAATKKNLGDHFRLPAPEAVQ